MKNVTTGLGEFYQYMVRPKAGYEEKYDATELRIVRLQLLGEPGVAGMSRFGGFLKQYEIAIAPSRLMPHSLTVADVLTAPLPG